MSKSFVDIFSTDKKYNIIYADPPWSYQDKHCQGAAAALYSTMKDTDIGSLPVGELADKDCILFLWATYPKMQEALEVIEAWGFKYKTIGFQWVKQNKSGNGFFFGLGRWTRGNTECCLIATKGKPKRVSNSVSQLVLSPLREHSRKPDVVRNKIVELCGDLPRIELFARTAVPGWDYFGNETDKFEEPEDLFTMVDKTTTATTPSANDETLKEDNDVISFFNEEAEEVKIDVC